MELSLSKHPYFEEFIDPQSGVKSYILKEKVAQLQQNFYFSEIGLTDDNEYMWFRCMNWPAEFIYLGVMSMNPEKLFISGSDTEALSVMISGRRTDGFAGRTLKTRFMNITWKQKN